MFDIFSKENYFTSTTVDKKEEPSPEININNYQEIKNVEFDVPEIKLYDENGITFEITGLQFYEEKEKNVVNENEEDVENEEENNVENEEENEEDIENEEENNDEDEDIIEINDDTSEDDDNDDKIYLLILNDYPHSYFSNKKDAQESILSFARTINSNENKDFPDSYIIEHTRNEVKVIRVFDFILFKYHHVLKHFKLQRIYKF